MTAPDASRFSGQRLLLQGCTSFLYLFVAVELLELLHSFYRSVTSVEDSGPRLLLSGTEVATFAPVFLGILILLELIETLRIYLEAHVVNIQLILLVGLTAITRHLLAIDLKHGDAAGNLSLAALILALGGAYFLIERSAPASPA